MNAIAAWAYYALLAWIGALLLLRWRPTLTDEHQRVAPLFSRNARRVLLCSLALLTVLATGGMAQAAQTDDHLTITLLTTGNPTQGEALFLRTPGGQTALIDEGADSATLAQTLDTRLPFWQRSLGLVILADPGANDLAGLQDVITRYQVGRVIDAGMLHPSVAYARWRSTLDTHNVPYTQVRKGALVSLGNQVSFQVLWPPAHLHKGSNETRDNALALRLLAPGLSMLLLNATALSAYTLQALSASPLPASLQAQIVQVTGEPGKSFPPALSAVLALARPSLLLVTATPVRKSKTTTTAGSALPMLPPGPWDVVQGAQAGSWELQSDAHGWRFL